MSRSNKVREAFRRIPSVDSILEIFKDELNSVPYSVYIITIRSVLDSVRNKIKNDSQIPNIPEYTYNKVRTALKSVSNVNEEYSSSKIAINLSDKFDAIIFLFFQRLNSLLVLFNYLSSLF